MTVQEVLPVILYILGSVLLASLIVLSIKLILMVNKVNNLVDNITEKANSLNGIFSIINACSNKFSFIGNKIVDFITLIIEKIFKRKDDKDE